MTHRFYVGDVVDKSGPMVLGHSVWVNDSSLTKQWLTVLRFRVSEKIVLFNQSDERLYEIDKIEQPGGSVHLQYITDIDKRLPAVHLILFWSLLKNDKNAFVLQKATELGVREFIPILTEHCENKSFDYERAKLIVKEAAEQCGRFDIPIVKEPILLSAALQEYSSIKLLVCEAGGSAKNSEGSDKIGALIGPEGGWSESEKALFADHKLEHINLSHFILRAETASIVAAAKLVQ